MILLLAALLGAPPGLTDNVPPPKRLHAEVHFGGGQLGSEWTGLVQPSFSLGSGSFDLRLTAPIWFESNRVRNDFQDPDTYSGVIENAEARFSHGSVRIGHLNDLTLGDGVLVAGYRDTENPIRPRAGAQTQWDAGRFHIQAMTDSIVDPHFGGGGVGC